MFERYFSLRDISEMEEQVCTEVTTRGRIFVATFFYTSR